MDWEIGEYIAATNQKRGLNLCRPDVLFHIKKQKDGNDDHNDQQAVCPEIGRGVFRGKMCGQIAPTHLSGGHDQAVAPVDLIVEGKNDDRYGGVNTYHQTFNHIGIGQTVPCTQHHNGQKEDAHAHLNESSVKTERQKGWHGDPVRQAVAGVGFAEPPTGLDEDDKQHKNHQKAENGLELIVAHPGSHKGPDHRPDDHQDDVKLAVLPLKLAMSVKGISTGGRLSHYAHPVGTVGEIGGQAQNFRKDSQGDGRTISRKGINAPGNKATYDCDKYMVKIQWKVFFY